MKKTGLRAVARKVSQGREVEGLGNSLRVKAGYSGE